MCGFDCVFFDILVDVETTHLLELVVEENEFFIEFLFFLF